MPETATALDCKDCGIEAWAQIEDGRTVHEDFYVHNGLWYSVCPDDAPPGGSECGYLLCIKCFEKRLGRKLERSDFKGPPQNLFGTPPSRRFLARWENE